jgi:Homeodomain-like domain
MRRVREILRLKHECGATDRAIARSLGIARSTVAVTLDRLAAAELGWPLPATPRRCRRGTAVELASVRAVALTQLAVRGGNPAASKIR